MRQLLLPLVFAATLGSASGPAPRRTVDAAADCRTYFGNACSEAMGAWLPRQSDASWLVPHAQDSGRRDDFIYEHERTPEGVLGFRGADDGTFFVYGNAGPPKGHAVYDYAQHIAFYDEGCCAWQEAVAAADAALPPKRVVARDLRMLHTVRGIRLGMSEAAVMRIYGRAPRRGIIGQVDSIKLAYTVAYTAPGGANGPPNTCGQWENFVFRSGRLTWIQLVNAC